ncbi:MAG TPA: pyruvate dehydrogenase (acetyl-transferring), homodimeric type [Actinomycetota bacterium]|nr:pyruvate dehydrogenase (acetyl-transferring), homodimeric type [Actinomycetota bacterium]
MYDAFKDQLPDIDPEETQEWIEALDQVVEHSPARARFLLHRILHHGRSRQVGLPAMVSTNYINTIPPEQEPYFPGNEAIELKIRRMIRWNAAVMVSRANKRFDGIGGHISTYASQASLYEVGFNHFFRGKDAPGGGDQVFIQGHGAPGIYARAFLEGRVTEEQLDAFRRECSGGGLASYPHPRLMPDFWEFPTVSMGLSPLNAIYQARFNRYLHHRGIKDTSEQRVWAFVGDGEMDEPESMAALSLAAREGLDNLVFVVNCNLQRLDGPVRGNGKIIQELESIFRGAGWHVIKVVWGREWDELLARDTDGVLVNKMNTTLDGEFQKYFVEGGAYIREHFFGPDPRLKKLVEHLSDEDLHRLRRGGHDYRKIYAAYANAMDLKDAPVVILAKTVKGWMLGGAIEGRNVTHQAKKLSEEELERFRDRLQLPIDDGEIHEGVAPYFHPGEDSEEIEYLRERRRALGGVLPRRKFVEQKPELPSQDLYKEFSEGTKQNVATTMAFVRILRKLLRDENLGKRIVPIIPDEARTFGMESLFPDFKIYAAKGQLYEPVDAKHLLAYRESQQGQILEEGITEAGSMGSFTAAATSYATHSEPMVPFFIFYSMFGFQRIADEIWSLADQRGRGFLLGATAGRTTLLGEGLQHQDGHSLLIATTNPACVSYDPAFAYEIATIVRHGLERMLDDHEDVVYYLTLYNEPYPQPRKPDGDVDDGILRGLYPFRAAPEERSHRAHIFGSGSLMSEALRAQELLAEHHDVAADVWSATSYHQLRVDGLETERWNRLHPEEPRRQPYVTRCLEQKEGPVVAVSDWMKTVPDQIARWVPGPFVPLGTDGFGRSDHRAALRRFFEIDAGHVVVATLAALAESGDVKPEAVTEAIERYEVEPDRTPPFFSH